MVLIKDNLKSKALTACDKETVVARSGNEMLMEMTYDGFWMMLVFFFLFISLFFVLFFVFCVDVSIKFYVTTGEVWIVDSIRFTNIRFI